MSRPRGGYIGFNRVPAATGFNSAAVGVWTLREAEALRRAGTWPTADGDPFFSNVSLLLHLDGSNGSTTFTDSSSSPKTVTASGASISTAQSKFGGASGSFGSSAYATIPINSAFEFGTGDFAVEAFVRITAFNANAWSRIAGIGDGANGGGPYTGWSFSVHSSNIRFYRYDGSTEFLYDAAVSLSTNTWYHVAVSRSGSTLSFYLDGTRVATFTSSATFNRINDNVFWIGRVQGGMGDTYLNGYVDDLRITKGSARGYTGSTITVPTAPFPDGGTPPVPGAPTGLSATAGNAQLSLSWTAPASDGGSAITGYRVQYTPSGGSASTVDTGSAAPSYTLTGLTNGTSYTVSVAAINGVGAGSYSSTATETPFATPAAPASLTIGSGACDGQWSASWAASSTAGVSYELSVNGVLKYSGSATSASGYGVSGNNTWAVVAVLSGVRSSATTVVYNSGNNSGNCCGDC